MAANHEHYHASGSGGDFWTWVVLGSYAQVTLAVFWSWLLGKTSMGSVVLSLVLTQSVGDVTVSSGVADAQVVVTSSWPALDAVASSPSESAAPSSFLVGTRSASSLPFQAPVVPSARAPPGGRSLCCEPTLKNAER